jgi:hypothetical protein
VAVKLTGFPAQTTALAGNILTDALVLTVALAEAVALQLFELVAVTVKLYPPPIVLLNVAKLVVLLKVPPELLQL